MFCIDCGGENPQDAVFCRECGKRIVPVGQANARTEYGGEYPSYPSEPVIPNAPMQEAGPAAFSAQSPLAQAQPVPVVPPAANHQTRNMLLGIIGLVLLIALIWGSYAYANRSTPERTLNNVCDGLRNGNYAEVYDQLTGNALNGSISEANWIASVKSSMDNAGGVTGCTVSDVVETDPTATGWMNITYSRIQAQDIHWHLIDENGTWKIDNIAGS
jgi:hypothetical protein